MNQAKAACAGLDYEHHEDPVMQLGDLAGLWECGLCGSSGTLAQVYRRIMPLLWMVERLQLQLLHGGTMILLPSEAPPKLLGTVWGDIEVRRVQGIPGPVVAIPGVTMIGDVPVVASEIPLAPGLR